MTTDARIDRVHLGELTFDVATSGPADGTPVVLLHGFPESSAAWRLVTPRLVDARMRVIAPNQRGYSPGARPPAIEDYRADRLVEDVIGLLDAYDLDTAHLVGHDWGAAVAWEVAGRHPDRLRSLTAVSVPHPAAFGWALREDEDQQRRSSYIGLLRQEGKAEAVLLEDDSRRLRAMFGKGVDPELVDEHVRLLSEPGALTAALHWYRAMVQESENLPPVRVPTTYVWSTSDPALGPAAAKRCGEFVDAPYRFVVLDGASHWIPEENPDALTDAILAHATVA
ncbi:alpha/beta fold hydrolase [Rhodococcus spongiicola]|uniref:Alpha/beta hydrolase n=1 Tax=Rhodococcus spongiicola TaxID=2487352 RepID=A0A438B1G8_9NOCA|nr:alpha/beta hydrolase [Rhodococcus spongiicola]RVW04777.1 alpha/beta hydrolase [Rhodococcus spongiicola]